MADQYIRYGAGGGNTFNSIVLNGAVAGSLTQIAAGTTTSYQITWPSAQGAASSVLQNDGSGNLSWAAVAGTGTVTSVGLLTDSSSASIFANTANAVTGSPITGAGSFTLSFSTQVKNKVLVGPSTGADAAPTFRLLVGADLPNPSSSTLGGIQSIAAVSSNWIRSISTSGVPAASQPAFTDISGSVAAGQMPALTGDVTTSAGAVATTVAKIQTTVVSGTTGSGNVVFSASPTLTGTIVAAAGTFSSTLGVTGALSATGTTDSTSSTTGIVIISGGLGLAKAFFQAAGKALVCGLYHLDPSEQAVTVSGGATTIDLSVASGAAVTLGASTSLTLTNPTVGGVYYFRFIQGASAYTVTWPGTVKWPAATAPVITVTNGKMDLISLTWDGTEYLGTFAQNFG